MKLIITRLMIETHLEECTICDKESVAPNGISRTDTCDMKRRISIIHENARMEATK